ncbi:MAG TPA: hypothetical protein PK821_05510 [Victivallales bacterium]|nr:hypothetical protein [Victivallales bacterium]
MPRPEKQDLNKNYADVPGVGQMSMPEKVCYNTAIELYTSWLSSPEVREGIAEILADMRGFRHGMPKVKNVLSILPKKLKDEVFDDAAAVVKFLVECAPAQTREE